MVVWGSRQAIVSSFATNKVHLDLWFFDAWKSSKNRLPNGGLSLVVIYHGITLNKSKSEKIAQQKQAQHQFKDILPPTLLTTSPNPPKIQESNVRTTWKQSKKMSVRHPGVLPGLFFDVILRCSDLQRSFLFLCHSEISVLSRKRGRIRKKIHHRENLFTGKRITGWNLFTRFEQGSEKPQAWPL